MAVETPEKPAEVAEEQAPPAPPRTVESLDAEIKALGTAIGQAYSTGDYDKAQQLQTEAGKLRREQQGLQVKEANQKIMAEIGPATYNAVRPGLMRVLQSDEFKAQAVKAAEHGFRTFQVTVTMPTKEQVEADANAAPGLDAKWTGGTGQARVRTASTTGTAGGGAAARAVIVDGERFETRASVVDRFGSDHEKQLPDSYKSGTARGILTRLEKEGHTVVVE